MFFLLIHLPWDACRVVGGPGSLAASLAAILLCPTIYSIKNGLKYIFELPNVHPMFGAASDESTRVPIPD